MTKETGYTRDEENISYMYTLPESGALRISMPPPSGQGGSMNRDDIIRMAKEAGLYHFYDSEGHCTGITDARLVTEDKDRWDDRLVEMLAPFAALVAAEKEREMQARVDTLYAMYEQACRHRDQLMDAQRATIAAMRSKT